MNPFWICIKTQLEISLLDTQIKTTNKKKSRYSEVIHIKLIFGLVISTMVVAVTLRNSDARCSSCLGCLLFGVLYIVPELSDVLFEVNGTDLPSALLSVSPFGGAMRV